MQNGHATRAGCGRVSEPFGSATGGLCALEEASERLVLRRKVVCRLIEWNKIALPKSCVGARGRGCRPCGLPSEHHSIALLDEGRVRSCQLQSRPPFTGPCFGGDYYSSRRFRSVHGGIGIAQHIFRIATDRTTDRYPDAGSDLHLGAGNREGLNQRVLYPPGDPGRVSGIPNIIQKYRELVAAKARQNVFTRRPKKCFDTGGLR